MTAFDLSGSAWASHTPCPSLGRGDLDAAFLFGIERFESFLLKNYMLEKDDFINALKKELGEFVPKHNFDDDILVVCLSNK